MKPITLIIFAVVFIVLTAVVGTFLDAEQEAADTAVFQWTPASVGTLTATVTPTPGWWDDMPTPSLHSITPTATATVNTTPQTEDH